MSHHALRIRPANSGSVDRRGRYVLYWMIGARRARWSFALEHATARARALDRPLVVLEALRVGYPWASDRLHRFVLDGMDDNAAAFARAGVGYLRYVEPAAGAGAGLLAALAKRAACVITDEVPGFFLPRMVAAAAARLPVLVETVDGTGVLPLRAFDRAYPLARSFRKAAETPLAQAVAPAAEPRLPKALRDPDVALPRGWRAAGDDLAALPIDHTVAPVARRGGARAAAAALDRFITEDLDRYGERDVHSGLSPYLHFGHLSAQEVAARVRASGSPGADKFLDELITWRELGHGFAFHRPAFDRYDGLPGWARATLDKHAGDPRPHLYDRATLEAAATGDPVWNHAQAQLVEGGTIQPYLRMLWGKNVIAWSRTAREAFATLVELNNKYALDGRDPNSYCGIAWCFGAFDRPWGPERPIYGTVRYMSSAQTARKLKLRVHA